MANRTIRMIVTGVILVGYLSLMFAILHLRAEVGEVGELTTGASNTFAVIMIGFTAFTAMIIRAIWKEDKR